MAVTITQDEAKLFESNGFSYDDVNNTVKHYRQEGLSDDAIQQKINSRIVQFRNALPKENEHALNNSLKKLPKDDPYVQTQEYQTEQLANLLFTPDELKAMEQQGKMGWIEYRSRGFVGWSDIMPFVGTIKQGYQAGKTLSLAKKMEKGEELSEADKTYMKNYLRNYVEIQKRGMTWGATGANMAVQAPAFMTEFCLSGGLGEIAAKGAISGAAKGAGKIATKTATKVAVTKAARIAGEQAVLVPMYATANYNQRKIADGLNVTDKGDMIFDSAQAESDKGRKVFEGLATGEIQVLSELSGGLLGKMAGKAIGVAEKTLGKVATTNVARGISATSAKLYNSLPKNVRIKLEASARLAEKLGKSATETGEKMKSKGLEFHGIAEEMGEERVEDILMTAFDVDSKEGYSADQWLDAIFPSPQQLLLEAGVFSIVGATSLATRTVANDLLSKGYSEQETQNIVNSLSEIEKENIANDIIGEVKMNEDITEEEVQQEQNAIQMKLFGRVEENVNAAETMADIGNTTKSKKTYNEEKKNLVADKYKDQVKFYNGEWINRRLLEEKGINFDKVEIGDYVDFFEENKRKPRSEYNSEIDRIAKNYFGTTDNINETGYILQDGSKLDFSGKKDGGTAGRRNYDHREIVDAFLDNPENKNELEIGFNEFIDNGAIRLMPESKSMLIAKMPSEKQLATVKDILDKYNGEITLELVNRMDEWGSDKNFRKSYDKFSNPSKIIEDIKTYYNGGKISEFKTYYDIEGGRTRKPKAENQKQQTQTPVTEAAETVENDIDVPETVADKIIRGESKFGKFYTEWVDRYTPIENLVKKAEQKTGEKLDTSSNPYFQARMYAGLVESIKEQVNDKTFIREKDGSIKITGEGFLPIINDFVAEVKDIEPNYDTAIEDLSDYLIANRYLLDLKDRDGYEATEEQKLKAIKDMANLNLKYGNKIDDISKIADRIYAFNQRILHNLVDSGNMSQETYDKIIEQNPHHISYKRVMDETYGTNGLSFARGKFTDAKSPVKKIRGSEREIQNIFVSTLEDVARILDVAERNKVAHSIANLKDILPEYIETKKPAMEKRTAKVKVTYDAKMRAQLLEAIKFFGRKFENAKSIKTPLGYALGTYSEEEKLIRKKLGSQDRTLAHEVGHMLDFALGVENKIKDNAAIMKEIRELAKDRFDSVIKLQDGEFITEEGVNSEKYKNYAQSNKEAIANAFDLYTTSRDYVKRVAPKTAAFFENLFKGKYAFLNQIRPSSETATEEIEQDVWTPSRNKPYGNVVQYFVEGKPKFIEVTKPVLDAVEGMSSQEIDFINKFFVGSASMLRTGATLTPEFAIRNFIRDQESAVIYVKNYNPFIDGIKGLFNVLGKRITGKNETYDEWVKAGGAFGSYMELNEKSVNKALKEFVGEGSKMRNIFNYGNPIKLAEEFSSIFEQATRLGMYTRSKMNGATAMEAALEAREGTLDFGRSGSLGRKYNKILPFFNAGIQGVDKMVRTFRDHPYLSSIKAIGSITLPQLAVTGFYLYFAPDDDREEYLNIPQYQKDFFYCFKVGDNWVRIPKDFTLGYVFGSVPERFMTWAFQNKKPEGKDLANMAVTLFGSVSPINNPTDILPPIARTLIENTANYDFFRGQHIYPEYMKDLEPSLKANKFNSETSKWLGEKLNMSPAIIDHTISSLMGTSGKYLTDAGDLMIDAVRKFNGEETNERVKTVADAPFLRGFVLRDPVGYQAVSTNEFFENYKETYQAYTSYNKIYRTGDREAARNYKEKHYAELQAYKRMNNTKSQISKLGKQMDKIYVDKNLTNKEKQELLQPLAKRISDMAFEANVWYGEFTKGE